MMGSDDGTRACCHEAGHAVTALSLGFKVKCICVVKGHLITSCEDFDSGEREDRFIVLAGGLAAEGKFYDELDTAASARDQKMIFERKGKRIDTYVPKAKKIIETDMVRFKLIRKRLEEKWRANALGSAFDPDPSFVLMSSSELIEIWTGSKPIT